MPMYGRYLKRFVRYAHVQASNSPGLEAMTAAPAASVAAATVASTAVMTASATAAATGDEGFVLADLPFPWIGKGKFSGN